MDRAGLVGDDGPTHHGCFDISYLRAVPNVVIFAPKDGRELRDALMLASTYKDGPFAIRYPRGNVPEETVEMSFRPLELGSWEVMREGADVAILAVGTMVYEAWKAADMLVKDGLTARVVNARFVRPMDQGILTDTFAKFDNIVTVCENAIHGGFGDGVMEWMAERGIDGKSIRILGIPDTFVEHGPREALLHGIGLDAEGIAMAALELHQKARARAGSKKTN
jgi:1-deoxy-D-xylulose-5-phosphate synthase